MGWHFLRKPMGIGYHRLKIWFLFQDGNFFFTFFNSVSLSSIVNSLICLLLLIFKKKNLSENNFFQGRKGWWRFEERNCEEIEENYGKVNFIFKNNSFQSAFWFTFRDQNLFCFFIPMVSIKYVSIYTVRT